MSSKAVVSLLGNLKKGLAFVVSAPAGTGKTTLVSRLTEEFPCVIQSISYTTRPMRPNEQQGIDYHFISEEEFLRKAQQGQFLEYARVFDYYYGTSKQFIIDQQTQGKHVVLVIDTQGALQLKEFFTASFIFISPPSFEELYQRLHKRQTEAPHVVEQRLSWAEKEVEAAYHYDYHIINEDIEIAYHVLKSIFIAEEHRTIYC
jgi:guanylate kinase